MKKRDILRGVMADVKASREASDKVLSDFVGALVALEGAKLALEEREKECQAALEAARQVVSKRDLDAVRNSTTELLAGDGSGADHDQK